MNIRLHSRRLAALLVAVGLALAAIPAVASTSHTKAIVFYAFKSSGEPAVKVSRTVRGSCNSGSAAADRNDAWRCFGGNFVYDPCFSSSKANGYVLCVPAPWKSSAVKLKYSGKLKSGNKRKPSTSGLPWAIRTTLGWKCEMDTGGSESINGKRANYFCAKTKDWLWGSPDRKSEPWTIFAAPLDATQLTTKVKIQTAWF